MAFALARICPSLRVQGVSSLILSVNQLIKIPPLLKARIVKVGKAHERTEVGQNVQGRCFRKRAERRPHGFRTTWEDSLILRKELEA
jgi:hypothetical protein